MSHLGAPLRTWLGLPYRDGVERCRLDLVLPPESVPPPWPVLVHIHGGGWSGGHRRSHLPRALERAAKTWAGINVGYRLSSEAPFPAAVADVQAAVRWLHHHAAALGLDDQRVVAIGDSAGGHLAAMLGLAGEFEPDGPWAGASAVVDGVIDLCGPSDLVAALDHIPAEQAEEHGWLAFLGGVAGRNERARAASPLHHLAAGTTPPPFLIVHGREDTVVPPSQATELAAALAAHGGAVTLLELDQAGHSLWQREADRARIDAAIDRFLDRLG